MSKGEKVAMVSDTSLRPATLAEFAFEELEPRLEMSAPSCYYAWVPLTDYVNGRWLVWVKVTVCFEEG